MQGEAEVQVRAWVDYFRDLGIHDFYRRGERAGVPAGEEIVVATIQAEVPAAEVKSAAEAISAAEAAPEAIALAAAGNDAPVAAEEDFPEAAIPADLRMAAAAPATMKLVSFNDLAPLPARPIPVAERAVALCAIEEEIGDCTRCPLAYAGRRKIVFGDGLPTARLMFVGEGPGADEDVQGIPFVGKAGQLLNNMITAMGLKREDVYIANIVKCRPPNNRVPEQIEANTCSQFLLRQIDVVQPEVIVALGATAATYLLGVKQSLSSLRGGWHTCRGAKLAVTYHPAFLLRDPRQKAEAWKDLQMVMGQLGLQPPARK
jgi:uracil-DNA glycosylase family 4